MGCRCREYGFALVSLNGHLEILQCARENSFPWDKRTCENTAYSDHLNFLQYTLEKMVVHGMQKHVQMQQQMAI